MATKPRVPRMVEPDAFEVGRDIATSPEAVVHRQQLYELIQFRPQTPRVRSTPLLIVPPTINKYYVLDLAPGRSLIEFLVGQGQQVFIISWRNPDASLRGTPARRTCCSPPTSCPALHEVHVQSYLLGLAAEGLHANEDAVRLGMDGGLVVRSAFTALPLERLGEPTTEGAGAARRADALPRRHRPRCDDAA